MIKMKFEPKDGEGIAVAFAIASIVFVVYFLILGLIIMEAWNLFANNSISFVAAVTLGILIEWFIQIIRYVLK